MSEIIEIAKENGFFDDALDVVDYYCEQDQKGRVCYKRSDYSGRDFYDLVPLNFITDEEREQLFENITDDLEIGDYNWNNFDEDSVYEELSYELIDEIIGRLTESKKRQHSGKSLKESDYPYKEDTPKCKTIERFLDRIDIYDLGLPLVRERDGVVEVEFPDVELEEEDIEKIKRNALDILNIEVETEEDGDYCTLFFDFSKKESRKVGKMGSKLRERNLTRAERANREADRIFNFKRATNNEMKKYLINHGVSKEEVEKLYDDDKLDVKLIELGLHDEFFDMWLEKSKGRDFSKGVVRRESKSLRKGRKLNESISVSEIAKFLKDSKETLLATEESGGCCRYVLDGDLCLYVGWESGYEDDNGHDGWEIVSKIGERNDYDWSDFEWLNMPWDPNTGDVWDTTTSADPSDADWYVKEYKEIRKALDNGEVVLESRKPRGGKRLNESSQEIDRKGFGSLIKYDQFDPKGNYAVLNDGYFCYAFWADSDEEAKEVFRKNGVNKPSEDDTRERELKFVNNRKNAILGWGDDPGFDEYDLESVKTHSKGKRLAERFPWEYQGNNNDSIVKALDNLVKAMDRVVDLCYGNAEGVDINDYNDLLDDCPIEQSFEDFSYRLREWVDELVEAIEEREIKTESKKSHKGRILKEGVLNKQLYSVLKPIEDLFNGDTYPNYSCEVAGDGSYVTFGKMDGTKKETILLHPNRVTEVTVEVPGTGYVGSFTFTDREWDKKSKELQDFIMELFKEDVMNESKSSHRGRKLDEARPPKVDFDFDEIDIEATDIRELYAEDGVEGVVDLPWKNVKFNYPEFAKIFEFFCNYIYDGEVSIEDCWEYMDEPLYKAVMEYIDTRRKQDPVDLIKKYDKDLKVVLTTSPDPDPEDWEGNDVDDLAMLDKLKELYHSHPNISGLAKIFFNKFNRFIDMGMSEQEALEEMDVSIYDLDDMIKEIETLIKSSRKK